MGLGLATTLSGDPCKLADDFHAAVCRAVFQTPLFYFVKYALRYKSKVLFIGSLLDAAWDGRRCLQTAFQDHPETKDTYIEVEKVSKQYSVGAKY
jgi:hypothetical protein